MRTHLSLFKTFAALGLIVVFATANSSSADDSTATKPVVYQDANAAAKAEALRRKKAAEAAGDNDTANKMQEMINQINASPNMGGVGEHAAENNNYGGIQKQSGDCSKFPKPQAQMLNTYFTCTSNLSATAKSGKAMIVDMDNKVGYIIDGQGNPIDCFTVTIGSNGQGTGTNQTEPGLFFSGLQDGAKYQTNNPDPESKGISMGIGGKIVHSDHGNRTTAGCIGIQQSKFMSVFDTLKNWNTPILAWGQNNQTCGPKGPSLSNPGTSDSSSGSGASENATGK